MNKSGRVTAAQELAILRLLNECVNLGDDAAKWQTRLMEGLRSLCGGMIASVGPSPPHGAGTAIATDALARWVSQQVGGGWPSAAVKARWDALVADRQLIQHHPGVAGFYARPEPTLSLTRPEIVEDGSWDRSPFVNDQLRADGMDEGLLARTQVPLVGCGYVLTVVRARGERAFARRVGSLCGRLLDALAPHLGRSLLLTTQPNRHGLAPRLQQVLDCLLDGDSEKEAALRLGLAASTVHDHVKRLYRHFGVSSRAELLAYFLRRYRTPNGGGLA